MCAEILQKKVVKQFYNGAVLMKLVPYKGQDTHPNGVAFYVNNGQGGVIGVRVYPDGRKVAVNPATNITDGTKGINRKRKQRYQKFVDAWGHHESIYASHAVYDAWSEVPKPDGMTIDHIDGCTTNNYIGNLRFVSDEINNRDGGFLQILRNRSFNPGTSSRQTGGVASAEKGMCIPRWMLLRYFDRMAYIKANISEYRYKRLTKEQLRSILFLPDEELKINDLIQTLKTKKKYAKRHQ